MNRLLRHLGHDICLVIRIVLSPIISKKALFVNIILLLIVPSIINAYWINHEQYITISPIYKYGFKIRDGASFPYILFVPYVLSYIMCLFSFLIRKIDDKIDDIFKLFVYFCLFSLFAVNVFCLLNFETMLSPSIIMLMVETNIGETKDFLFTYLLSFESLVAYSIILSMFLLTWFVEKYFYTYHLLSRSMGHRYYFKICVLCFISIYLFQRSYEPLKLLTNLLRCENLSDAEFWYLTYPVNTNVFSNCFYSVYVMYLSKEEIKDAKKSTLSTKQRIESDNHYNLVLIVGESFSKYHSNLYLSSHLNTNPRLKKMVDSGNLFVFDNVISSFNLTSFVLRNLFSVNSIMNNENWSDYPAFPILFKKAGYNVYMWDNQRTFGKADVSDFSIASYLFDDTIAQSSYTSYNQQVFQYDWDLIKDFNAKVNISDNNNLVIFHLMGQHTMPEKRYPVDKNFIRFSRDSISRKDLDNRRKDQIAHYENATFYNDWVVSNIISMFVKSEAVVIYLSDHGEELYDFRDHYGRTQETKKTSDLLKYQYEIPFMIWCSDIFISNHPEIITNIKGACHKPFMNDNVCQILLGLAGIRTSFYHPERDLISSQFVPYNYRKVQNTICFEEIRYGKKIQ